MGDIEFQKSYDVIVIGAGHAGCEAALLAARMGKKTLLMTLSLDAIALPPCNPSIGGSAKGQVVREIDALGGEMGRNIDETFIQIKLLNHTKGPAMQALRAQMDRRPYMERMKKVLENQKDLDLKQGLVVELLVTDKGGKKNAVGVKTHLGMNYKASAVVITAGTSLDSRIIIGSKHYSGGRNGEMPAVMLAKNLRHLGLKSVRWKTGTPPRLNADSINWDRLEIQPGHSSPLFFGHYYSSDKKKEVVENSISRRDLSYGTRWWRFLEKKYPETLDGWLPQVACFLTETNEKTHEIVRNNLDRAPMYNGLIEGAGPRYCPSFEAKVVNFPDKKAHLFFLEPEGWNTNEVYLQGANTSLPEDVQIDFVRSIKGLEEAEIMRVGYAIEYDGISTQQLQPTLESKVVGNLFLAGQVNGTSGYEEAAGQGVLAGINAALRADGKELIWFKRSEAYLGVLIDDLINKEIVEPYRLMSARAEYRLLLRSDNADLRLSDLAYKLGTIDRDRYDDFCRYKEELQSASVGLESRKIRCHGGLNKLLSNVDERLMVKDVVSYADFLKRPQADISLLGAIDESLISDLHDNWTLQYVKKLNLNGNEKNNSWVEAIDVGSGFNFEVLKELEIQVKYSGYIEKQEELVKKFNRLEDKKIPVDFDFSILPGLRNEAREALELFNPRSLGQARRLAGVNPADLAILMVWLEKKGNWK